MVNTQLPIIEDNILLQISGPILPLDGLLVCVVSESCLLDLSRQMASHVLFLL